MALLKREDVPPEVIPNTGPPVHVGFWRGASHLCYGASKLVTMQGGAWCSEAVFVGEMACVEGTRSALRSVVQSAMGTVLELDLVP